MRRQFDVLVASSDIEDRQALVRVLDGLSLNVVCCNTLAQVAEVLSRHEVDLVFCDDCLLDGSYHGLLMMGKEARQTPRIVITIRTGEWKEYMEAMCLGAFDAFRRPWHPTDVEFVVLRAMHECDRVVDEVPA